MTDPVPAIFAVLVGAVVFLVPTILMGLLIYHGEKWRWRRKRPPKRGFEVILKPISTRRD